MASAAATPASAIRWTTLGRFTVAFLGIAAGVQMADRGLQAILLGAIQASFRVDDATINALQGLAGVLIGGALAVPIGRIGYRSSRKRLLLALVAAWAVLMAASALAPTFALFFAGRAALA